MLFGTDGLHCFVGHIGELAGAGTAGTVGASHAAKPLVAIFIALENTVHRHELEVVLVRADAEVSGAWQRVTLCVRNVEV